VPLRRDAEAGPPEEPGDVLWRAALAEDVGGGDLSALHFVPAEQCSRAALVARQEGVLSGVDVFARLFALAAPEVRVDLFCENGSALRPGQTVATLDGPTRALLTVERTALNFVQQLSGVASLTARYVQAVEGTTARILDTRKTVPLLRSWQKRAVRHGGGHNHRLGLFDMVMLKDNHVAAADLRVAETRHAWQEKIHRFREAHPGVRVEIEADSVELALAVFQMQGVDVVMLDNLPPDELHRCVAERPEGVELEASGGITLTTVRAVAETGVDWISIGALTHSAPALDFGLDFSPV
jgi:nicotinate-nucleotide pyrophosphorylase (carboxylating)